MLHTVPLQTLLDWLSKPKGPYLVEAPPAAVPDKALAIAINKRVLYGEVPPSVGVGLVYKPHYISMEPFSATYMHLHVWHAAGSSVDSEDKLCASHLIFMSISEMSKAIPVVAQHLVLLDVASEESMTGTGEPLAPCHFRGFSLHTFWNQQPGGALVHQITLPCFQGEGSLCMLEYESKKLPQTLKQGPRMSVNLRQPFDDHWNITSDLVLLLAIDTFRKQHEAKQTTQGLEGESKGTKASPMEASAPGEPPSVEAGTSAET